MRDPQRIRSHPINQLYKSCCYVKRNGHNIQLNQEDILPYAHKWNPPSLETSMCCDFKCLFLSPSGCTNKRKPPSQNSNRTQITNKCVKMKKLNVPINLTCSSCQICEGHKVLTKMSICCTKKSTYFIQELVDQVCQNASTETLLYCLKILLPLLLMCFHGHFKVVTVLSEYHHWMEK